MPLNFDTREVILEQLSMQQIAKFTFTHRLIIDFTHVNDVAGLTKTLSFALTKGAVIEAVGHVCETAFAGGSISSLTVSMGNDGESDNFLAAKEMISGSVAADSFATPGVVLTADDNLDVKFTAVTANLDALTAGKVILFLRITNLRRLANE